MPEDAQRSDASPLDVARQAELFELRHSRDELAAILGGIGEGVTVQDTSGALRARALSGKRQPES